MPTVPPELSDYIVDYLHDDPRSLAACCLTCRDWLPSARYHLFSSIVLHSAQSCEAFARLLEPSPHLGFYVRELNLTKLGAKTQVGSPKAEKHLPSIMTRLQLVQTLGVSLLDMGNFVDSSVEFCTSVTELQIQYCAFASFEDFLQTFSSLPRLENLTLRGVSWTSRHLEPRPRPATIPKLRTLVLGRDLDLSTLVEFILLGSHHNDITNLSACCTSDEDASSIGALLEVQGAFLKHLDIEWNPCRTGVNAVFLPNILPVQQCTNLETLSLRCAISDDISIPWVTSLLSDIQSNHITNIAIEIRLLGSLDALDWTSMVQILCESKYRHLQSINFKVAVWSGTGLTDAEVRKMIRERLAIVDLKGLVHFT